MGKMPLGRSSLTSGSAAASASPPAVTSRLMAVKSRLVPIPCVVALVIAATACATPGPSPVASAAASLPVAASPATSASSAPPTPSSAATPSAAPASAGDVGWTKVAIPDPGTFFSDIAVMPSGLAIVGLGGAAAQVPLAWTSTDGTTWSPERPGGDGRTPTSAVPWGDRLLVVGAGGTGRCAHPAALDSWMRDARGTWTEAPWSDDFCVGGSGAAAVAADHAVLVGVGSGDVPFVWRTADGLRWKASPIGAGAIAPMAAANLRGTDLVFGTGASGAWLSRSPDGSTWSPLEPLGTSPDPVVFAAVPLGARLAVIVRDQGHAVGTMLTDDGVHWTSVLAKGLDGDTLARVVAVDGGLVALGGDDTGARAWASIDGETWRTVAVPADAATLTGAAVFDGRAWLSGQAQAGDVAAAAAWVAPVAAFRR